MLREMMNVILRSKDSVLSIEDQESEFLVELMTIRLVAYDFNYGYLLTPEGIKEKNSLKE